MHKSMQNAQSEATLAKRNDLLSERAANASLPNVSAHATPRTDFFRSRKAAKSSKRGLPPDASLDKLAHVNANLREELEELTRGLEEQLVRMKEKREREMFAYKERPGDTETMRRENEVKSQRQKTYGLKKDIQAMQGQLDNIYDIN